MSTLTFAQSVSITAFPGAEGFGAHTTGGRGGKVIKVTNLNDSGPGSLRTALEYEGRRIIIFTIGGIINLETKLSIRSPYVTIAGQTAPGDGICIRGNGLSIQTNNVIVRYLRIRPGDIDFGPKNRWNSVDALSLGTEEGSNVYDIIIDHCSLSWAVDENIGMWGDTHDVTIQHCIISEALHDSKHPKGPHSMGMLIGNRTTNISIHHNLFSSNIWRNPMINGESLVDFRNNVVYNYGRLASHIDRHWSVNSIRFNYVNNYLKKGPNTSSDYNLVVNERAQDHVQIYIAGNRGNFPFNATGDNWNMVTMANDKGDTRPISKQHQVDQEFSHPYITTHSAPSAYQLVLANAGATFPLRDAVDRKVVSDVKEGKGRIVSSKNKSYEWPYYKTGIPFRDDDNDGMPNHWEDHFGLDKKNSNDYNLDKDDDGYTTIEEYINSIPTLETQSAINARSASLSSYPNLVFDLKQSFPNPSVTTTTIAFTLYTSSIVTLQLANSEGKIVKSFIDDFLYEGEYDLEVDVRDLVPGLYYLSLLNYDKSKIIKIIKK